MSSLRLPITTAVAVLAVAAPAPAATWNPPESAPTIADGRPLFDASATAYLLDATGHNLAIRPRGGAFTGPIDLIPSEPRPQDARFGVSGAGEVAAVYTRLPARGRKVHKRVRVVFRAPDGTVSAPRTISALGRTAETPQIAVNPRGDAIAAWQRHDGSGVWRVQVASRRAGGVFSAPVTVPGTVARRARIVAGVRPDGTGFVVFNDRSDRDQGLRTLNAVHVADGRIGDVLTLDHAKAGGSYGADGMAPRIATGADGTMAVLFLRDTDGPGAQLRAAESRPGDPSFAAARVVATTTGPVLGWDVGVDGAGRITALWSNYDSLDADVDDRVKARVWTSTEREDGSYGDRVGLSDATKTVSAEGSIFDNSLGLQVLPDGRALATWASQTGFRDVNGRIAVAARGADGSWGGAEYVTPADQRAYIPRLGLAADGEALITYIRFPSRGEVPTTGFPVVGGRL